MVLLLNQVVEREMVESFQLDSSPPDFYKFAVTQAAAAIALEISAT